MWWGITWDLNSASHISGNHHGDTWLILKVIPTNPVLYYFHIGRQAMFVVTQSN